MDTAVANRWTIEPASAEQDLELLDLFAQVFGHQMPMTQWRWKYADALVRGTILRRQGVAVAFCGGMPRMVAGPSGAVLAVQNGDVMVLPSERGVFSRKGALHHVVGEFMSTLVGPGKAYEFAFGFPSERHFKLGTMLDHYADSGRMSELTWTPLESSPAWWQEEVAVDAERLRALAALWHSMRQSWQAHYIPVRDAARWSGRFMSHPSVRYRLLMLRRKWIGTPVCALVLREHPSHVEWLDFAGPAGAADDAVALARRFAARSGNKPLVAMFSESVAPAFGTAAATCRPGVFTPVNFRPAGEDRPYVGRLWLMGGDTDFL